MPLFSGLDAQDIDQLAEILRVESYGPGEPVVEIGEPGRSLFIVTEGAVQVLYPSRHSAFELARLGPGDFFGEMALLNDKPRSATVRTIGDVGVLKLDKADFRQLIVARPQVGLLLLEALSVRIRTADEQISGLSDQAVRDPLTGLLNRRAFNERIQEEADRTRRYGEAFSLILIDLDHFKSINDALGHDIGDQVLGWIGRLLTEHTRAADSPFRIGGEEFAIICPATKPEVAHAVAQRLVTLVGEAKPATKREVTLTMSASYASAPDHTESPEVLYSLADQGLLRAKREGRNRVVPPVLDPALEAEVPAEVAAAVQAKLDARQAESD